MLTDLVALHVLGEEVDLQEPLLTRIANGDTGAVDECIDRYGGLVWSMARRLSSSVADAEDAVQEIFIDLCKKTRIVFARSLAEKRLLWRCWRAVV